MKDEPTTALYEETEKFHWRLPLMIAAVTGVVAVASLLWLGSGATGTPALPAPEKLPPLDGAARAYLGNITIENLQPSKWGNMLGQDVIYLDGTLTNTGDKKIIALELTIEFKDPYGILVKRETFRPVGAPRATGFSAFAPPLPAGASREFRAGFENIPPSWNQGTPSVRITGLLLE